MSGGASPTQSLLPYGGSAYRRPLRHAASKKLQFPFGSHRPPGISALAHWKSLLQSNRGLKHPGSITTALMSSAPSIFLIAANVPHAPRPRLLSPSQASNVGADAGETARRRVDPVAAALAARARRTHRAVGRGRRRRRTHVEDADRRAAGSAAPAAALVAGTVCRAAGAGAARTRAA